MNTLGLLAVSAIAWFACLAAGYVVGVMLLRLPLTAMRIIAVMIPLAAYEVRQAVDYMRRSR